MRKNVLWLLVAVAVLAAGTVLAMPPQERGGNVGLTSSLAVEKWQHDLKDEIALTFELTNLGADSVSVLRWQMPAADLEADLLIVERDGVAVPYEGMLAKRPAPSAEDYVEILPGETFSVTFDPSAAYDMTVRGEYTIRYRGRLTDVLAERSRGGVHAMGTPAATRANVASNAVNLYVEGVEPGFRLDFPITDMTISGYNKCTTSQQTTLQTAHANAITISGKAKNNVVNSELYTWWFGTYSPTNDAIVTDHFNKINDAFVNKPVVYDCGCKKPYYAYVYPSQPYKIYVCKVFWTASALGRDSKAGTLVHEMSHFYVVASTDDYVYGATGAHNLALTDPAKAIDNADNHEYFAEDQP
jgi:peptidyl-Lys metalloendopeptidase